MTKNFLEGVRDQIVEAMVEVDRSVADFARDMDPYDQEELTPEEEDYFFENMAALYRKADPTMTNADAMQLYRAEVGDEEFVKLYERVYRRRVKEGQIEPAGR